MRKMLSIGLMVVMACSLVLVGQRKADAMDTASAVIVAGTMAFIGGAVVGAIANDAYAAERVYGERRPVVRHEVHTRVLYSRPDYRICDRPHRLPWHDAGGRVVYERGGRHDRW